MAADDAARKGLVGEAVAALPAALGRGPLPRLAADLFARASVEDMAAATPAGLAAMLRAASDLLARRSAGEPEIAVLDVPAAPGPASLVAILNDNMPFLVDSALGELQASGAAPRLVAHPVISVERDSRGRLRRYLGTGKQEGALRESLIVVLVDRIAGAGGREALAARLASLSAEIRRAVDGWRPMLDRLRKAVADYGRDPPPVSPENLAEALAFLAWLGDDNFTFLGAREYVLSGGVLRRSRKPGLGILSDPSVRVLRRGGEAITGSPAVRDFLLRPEPLIVAKANLRSRIHRRAYMDYVGIKLYRKGEVAGELRFVGLFTSTAYTDAATGVPLLRRKVANVLASAGFDPAGHSGKALATILEFYPRDDLFQIDEETLLDFALQILALGERPRIRVLARRDKFDRFVSVIVYVPRDRYDSDVRGRIGAALADAFAGHVSAFYPSFPEGSLARVHFIIGRSGETERPDPDQAALEATVASIVRLWEDGLGDALDAAHPPGEAARLRRLYAGAFPVGYREAVSPGEALADIAAAGALTPERPAAGAFSRDGDDAATGMTLRLLHLGAPIALSVRVPVLENMGFRVIDEQTFELARADGARIHIHEMNLERADGVAADAGLAARLIETFMAVWYGAAENDGYNALTLLAGLPWRDIAFLRTLSRYLHQAGAPWPQGYMARTLAAHPGVAADLVGLMKARFTPGAVDEAKAVERIRAVEAALEAVKSLDEDRIVRRFLNLLDAVVRTDFFQTGEDGAPHPEISVKFEARRIDELPAPRPFREIFVHSPRVDGVHLRFGPVARGGIRWSDRPLDFRTETLGLAKAQQVKNAVIVPVGAKGGFSPKRLPPDDRAAQFAEGTEAYRRFVARLLGLTDNLDGGRVVPPKDVVRRDGDDPYLVVAADKGTATFSDTANALALDAGFWLGDAFASGGSAGYDHKEMGITARGAFEAVKRHFREMDVDILRTPFTLVGVGDMSGDVFGNFMLLTPAARLLAAFDHRDIFIDPDPDPASGLAERRRLFDLPRSSWRDYDPKKISKGGGVFSRAEKAIRLGPEAAAAIGLDKPEATPNEVIRAILRARVDLLYFGGIGTFVRASTETDERVGDRGNDAVRVTANELRVRVVGEGGNLAMTQRARIEFGLAGGRCNSDAIDNSGGVNASDLEVNIKIALARPVRAGRLDLKGRNRLLAAMTGEVSALVLRNNYLQTLAISLAHRRGFEDFPFQQRLMQALEGRGLLDRAVEALPDDAALAERQARGEPLTRAEIGVLLAYAKIVANADLVAGGVADDPTLDNELQRYFPAKMRKKFAADIEAHRLRPEIIATMIANSMVNRGGPTYLVRVSDRTGAGTVDIARASVAVREAFALRDLNAAIDALDNRIPGALQLDLYAAAENLLIDRTVWFLRNADFSGGVGPLAEACAATVAGVAKALDRALPAGLAARTREAAASFEAGGVPAALALAVARLPVLADAADIHLVMAASKRPLAEAAAAWFAVGEAFRLGRIGGLAAAIPAVDYYDGLARDRALETLDRAQRRIAIEALAAGGLERWRASRGQAVERTIEAATRLTETGELTLSRLSVAANLLADLTRG